MDVGIEALVFCPLDFICTSWLSFLVNNLCLLYFLSEDFVLYIQYILKDSVKNTNRRDKSNFILVPRREDQSATSSGIGVSDVGTGMSIYLSMWSATSFKLSFCFVLSFDLVFYC